MFERFLGNERVIVRFISLYAIGLTLFFISWVVAYYLLPEGMLRGIGFLGRLAGDTAADTLQQELIRIFAVNVLGSMLIVVGNYILRVKYFAFGYLVPLAWMIMYAVTLGTNSFSIPLEEAMAPSLAVFARSGLYEMMAGVLLAVSTNTIAANVSESFFSPSQPVPKEKRWPMQKEQWIGVGVAFVVLFVAAFREAYMIFNQ